MKIYTAKNREAKSSVEMSLSHNELKNLIDALSKFEDNIQQFKAKYESKDNLGFTHLHLKDCGLIDESSKADVVFYIDLNDK
jgi:hypothetical protein